MNQLLHIAIALAALVLAPSATAVQGIEAVEIETNAARVDGSSATDFVISFTVEGAGLSSVFVTPPGGSPLALPFDPVEGVFFAASGVFGSLAALRAQYPLGLYSFTMNGGMIGFDVDYIEVEPPGFADATYPLHGGLSSSAPRYSWTVCPQCPALAGLDVSLEELASGSILFETSFLPAGSGMIDHATGATSPTPTVPIPPLAPLSVGVDYLLGLDIVRGQTILQVVGGDFFDFSAWFRKDLDVVFRVADADVLCQGDGGGMALCTPCPCGNDAASGTIGGCSNTAGTSPQLGQS